MTTLTSTTEADLAAVKKAVATAKIAILTRSEYVFYGVIVSKLKIEFDDTIKTACTDGISIKFSPAFMLGLTHRQRVFVLMHELKHVIYKHTDRLRGRDHKLWNCAADYVINNYLDRNGFDLVPDVLLNHKYDGMTADQVYLALQQEKKNDPSFDPQPDHDDLLAPNSLGGGTGNQADKDKMHEYIDGAIGEAMVHVQMKERAGIKASSKIPGEILRYWEEITRPIVDWRTALARFLHGAAKTDYTWRRPSRRGMALDLYLPTLYGESMDCIDFAIDTSGSVSEDTFNKFIGEIAEVFSIFNPQNIGITQFDTSIKDERRVCTLEEFKEIKFAGGGGTDVVPVLEAFKDSEGKALVILTDGYFNHSIEHDPCKPVVWAIYDNLGFVPAFGEAVHFTLED